MHASQADLFRCMSLREREGSVAILERYLNDRRKPLKGVPLLGLRHAAVVVRERDRPRRPVGVKFGLERMFVFKSLDGTSRALIRGNKQDRRQAVAGAPVESDVTLPQWRECVVQEL